MTNSGQLFSTSQSCCNLWAMQGMRSTRHFGPGWEKFAVMLDELLKGRSEGRETRLLDQKDCAD